MCEKDGANGNAIGMQEEMVCGGKKMGREGTEIKWVGRKMEWLGRKMEWGGGKME